MKEVGPVQTLRCTCLFRKKTFDSVWHNELWLRLRLWNKYSRGVIFMWWSQQTVARQLLHCSTVIRFVQATSCKGLQYPFPVSWVTTANTCCIVFVLRCLTSILNKWINRRVTQWIVCRYEIWLRKTEVRMQAIYNKTQSTILQKNE